MCVSISLLFQAGQRGQMVDSAASLFKGLMITLSPPVDRPDGIACDFPATDHHSSFLRPSFSSSIHVLATSGHDGPNPAGASQFLRRV